MKIATAVRLLVAVLMGDQTHAAPVIQATLTMGNGTAGMGIDVATRKVFVSNYADGTLTVVHADTLAVLGTVPAGAHPRRLIVNSASNLVYVVNDNAPGTVSNSASGDDGPAHRGQHTLRFHRRNGSTCEGRRRAVANRIQHR